MMNFSYFIHKLHALHPLYGKCSSSINMHRLFPPLPVLLGPVLLIILAVSLPVTAGSTGIGYAIKPSADTALSSPTSEMPVRDWQPETITLDPPLAASIDTAASDRSGPGPTRIGFKRLIPLLADRSKFSHRAVWHPTDEGGLIAAFMITSPSAKAIRLGLRIRSLPENILFRFYDPDQQTVFTASGTDIRNVLQRNRAAGEIGDDAETYWTPVIEGDTQIVEVELAPGLSLEDVDMALPELSHLFQAAVDSSRYEATAVSPCHNDVSCYAAWSPESNATARMIFTKSGASYLCSGTLLNYLNNTTYIPYFLTANHCISLQTVASSLQTYWFYRSSSCNGPLGSYQTRTGGAELLFASENTDTSFMRLTAVPPPGTVWAGWLVSLPVLNQKLTGVHHPQGDLQKISFGDVDGYGTCVWNGSAVDNCYESSSTDSTGFFVNWTSGLVEPGSSGSGIFNANHQLLGTLAVGNVGAGCGVANVGGYGRFDIPYTQALYQWLNSPGNPSLNAAVLPYARAVEVNDTASAFGTVINNGTATATGCLVSLPPGIPATFSYQTTNASNVLVGSPNTPVDIPAGGTQSFVFGITPTSPLSSTEIGLVFDCANSNPAPSHAGLNTLILTASPTPPPDLVAIGATPSNDGVVRLTSPAATGFFATAAVNIGSGGTVTASADDGGKGLPVNLQLCETDSAGNWISCGNNLMRSVAADQTVYYTVFVTGTGQPISFDPANNRLFLRFSANGQTVGATNVAVTVPSVQGPKEKTIDFASSPWSMYSAANDAFITKYVLKTDLYEGINGWYVKGVNINTYPGFPSLMSGTAVQGGFNTNTGKYYIIDFSAEKDYVWDFQFDMVGESISGCRYRYLPSASDYSTCYPVIGKR